VRNPIRETDLYEPVKHYLEDNGYLVRAEVKDCDIAAIKNKDLVVVELKKSLTIQLLLQATERQRLTSAVYIAIPAQPKRGKKWRGILRLLRMLELGLIVVHFDKSGARSEVVLDPLPYDRKKNYKKRRAVIKEIADRSGDYNTGGSTRTKLITAYKEEAVYIAYCLSQLGASKPAKLRALGTGAKTTSILSNNHYGWFQRIDRGIYDITALGKSQLKDYSELVSQFKRKLKDQQVD